MKQIINITIFSSLLSIAASAAIVNETANVRMEPSIQSEVVHRVVKDTRIEVLQKIYTKTNGTWYQLQTGYISTELLTLEPNEIESKFQYKKSNDTNTSSFNLKDDYRFNTDKTKLSTVFVLPVKKDTINKPTPIMSSIDNNNSDIQVVVKEDTNTTQPIVVENTEDEIEQKYDYFVGVSVNLNTLSVSQSNANSIILPNSLDDKTTSFEIEIGTILQDKYIVSANYEILNLDNIKLQSYFLSLDYKFNHFLNPYLGISLGNTDLSWQTDPLNTSTNRDYKASSLLFGIQAGIQYPLTPRWSVYSQASYQKLNLDTNLKATNTSNTQINSTISHEDKKALGVGIRYSF